MDIPATQCSLVFEFVHSPPRIAAASLSTMNWVASTKVVYESGLIVMAGVS
ncbi:MAG: hypothetical protein QOI39_4423 [Mycobacterium sp.]|jgi:hypothetical protein|nr:hypothetical protein [Mycobacterium sp.]